MNIVRNYSLKLRKIHTCSIEEYIGLLRMLNDSVEVFLVNIPLAKSTEARVLHIINIPKIH